MEADGCWFAAGAPGEAAEEVVPARQVGAVVAGFGQVGAVVEAVLFGTGQQMVEAADADVDVGVDEIALGDDEEPRHQHGRAGESGQGQGQLDEALGEDDVQHMVDTVVGDVDLLRHVVHPVQAPQEGAGVAQPVHQIADERSGQEGARDLGPEAMGLPVGEIHPTAAVTRSCASPLPAMVSRK